MLGIISNRDFKYFEEGILGKRMAVRGADVYGILKNKIVSLAFYPGEMLKESFLAEQLYVSRTPVREALILLANEKLVEIYPQRGTYVSKIDIEYVRQLMKMRHVIELDIFLELCRKKPQIQKNFIENMFSLSLAIQDKNIADYLRIDGEFHRMLFSCAGYPVIWDKLCRSHNTRYRLLDISSFSEKMQDTFDEHKKILECIVSGDEQGLKDTMERHNDPNIARQKKLMEMYPDYFGSLDPSQNQQPDLAVL